MTPLTITLTGPVAMAWIATMKSNGISDHNEMALHLLESEFAPATPVANVNGYTPGDLVPLVVERGGARVNALGEPSAPYRVKMIDGPAALPRNRWMPSTNAATEVAKALGENVETNIGSGFVVWHVKDQEKPYAQLEEFGTFLVRQGLRTKPSRRRS